jgi:two-component system, OmpR family, response regulator
MALRVLIVDDDARLFELLESYLAQNGIVAESARDGQSGLALLDAGGFDAVLLDVMMPGLDGLSVLRKIRGDGSGARGDLPVIMLTAKGDETDRVVGLELGADDYLPKPFSPRELLARLRAVVRRSQVREVKKKLVASGVSVDLDSRRVERGGAAIELTGLEFDVLVALIQRAGRVVPRTALLELAGRNDVTVSDRTVDVHVSHLRKKLGDDPPRLIRTVRGIGYMFAREDP